MEHPVSSCCPRSACKRKQISSLTIEAFFSWTEHALIHIAILRGIVANRGGMFDWRRQIRQIQSANEMASTPKSKAFP